MVYYGYIGDGADGERRCPMFPHCCRARNPELPHCSGFLVSYNVLSVDNMSEKWYDHYGKITIQQGGTYGTIGIYLSGISAR